MKILICLSCVPDTTTKAKFSQDNKSLDFSEASWILNPWDELALTRIAELKEKHPIIKEIVTITVGTNKASAVIKKGLAIGSDRAVRIDIEPQDAYFTAHQIAHYLQKEQFDLIVTGINSSDYNSSLTGGMLAELLNYPSITSVSGIEIENDKIRIEKDNIHEKEILTTRFPCLLVIQKGFAKEPRIANMRGIMMARQKTITVENAIEIAPRTQIVNLTAPKEKGKCKFIDSENIEELVEALKNEAKVLGDL